MVQPLPRSHRAQAVEDEMFHGRNDPPSGDGGYRKRVTDSLHLLEPSP